ncbi:hypothetical protein EP331_03425 [bacterium]|nr:MAG: hypothetical protein EP331_03425 [bacterium]
MNYCLLEDNDRYRFAPLTLTRPVHTLLMGMMTLGERWQSYIPKANWIDVHPFPFYSQKEVKKDWKGIAVNPRILPNPKLIERIEKLSLGEALLTDSGSTIAVHSKIDSKSWTPINQLPQNTTSIYEGDVRELEHIWQLMQWNGDLIYNDFEHLCINDNRQIHTHYGVIIIGNYPVFMHKSAVVEPGVVLVADDGPIYISNDTKILAGSLIRGPFYLGEHSVVKMGAHLYKDTSIGKYCKIGGEISASIIHDYSNKSHGGYIGNSIIGKWCNLGADTNCSNLKNNYSTVRIHQFPNGDVVDSGLQFLGVMMGDYCKMGINSTINTGSVFGTFCNVAKSGFLPKFIESFTWMTDEQTEVYDIEKAIQTIKIVKARRDVQLTPKDETILRTVFEQRNWQKV